MLSALAAVGEEEQNAVGTRENPPPPGRWSWAREFSEMVPNWALEKHAWLGAGWIWKRIHASSTTNRQEEEQSQQGRSQRRTQEVREAPNHLPFKALPLITVWDASYRDTYHKDVEANKADGDLSWRCPLTSRTDEHYQNPEVMYGIVTPDRPWLLSPPEIPVGATEQDPSEVKVMVYHG